MHRSKQQLYSITSSARTSNEGGTVLGSLHVDHQLEFGRLLDWQIGRLGVFEDLVDVAACTVEQIGYIGAVDDQSAIGELSEEI
jgi:hypothetical protein